VTGNKEAQRQADSELNSHGNIQRDALSNFSNEIERLLPEQNSSYKQARLAHGTKRPKRILIDLLDKVPLAMVESISPASVKFKKNLKWPLLLYCLSCSILSGTSFVTIKSAGEIWVSNFENSHWSNTFLALFLIAVAIITALVNAYALNKAFCHYNNLDVLPIYQSCCLLMIFITGLLVLNEQAFYTSMEILGLIGSAAIVIFGIWVLTKKQIHTINKEKQADP
jgi:uncharacterized membrane protein